MSGEWPKPFVRGLIDQPYVGMAVDRTVASSEDFAEALKRSAERVPATPAIPSSFMGKPAEEPPAPPSLTEYRIRTTAGVRWVEVDYFGFSETHVIGYAKDPGSQGDRLVMALLASDVREIEPVDKDATE